MKVILTEKVKNLGNVGEKVNVSSGFARNFLIPNKFAVVATEGNKNFIDDQQRRLLKKIEDQKKNAIELKKKIDGIVVELSKKVGGNGKLFGTVTSSELVRELEGRNLEIERKWIHIDSPIKQLGEFPVKVRIVSDVEATFMVKVVMDAKQAEELKKKQEMGLKKSKESKEKDEGAEGVTSEGENPEKTEE